MATLTDEMKELINTRQCLVATASKDGRPNIGPKGSVMVVDDSTLAFGEIAGKQTYSNLKENPQIAIAIVNHQQLSGYRFVGTAQLEDSGPLYDQTAAVFASIKLPRPIAVARVNVEEIYDLAVKNAGGRIS